VVAWVAASGGIAEDVRLRKRASRSLTKTGFCLHVFVYFFGCFSGVVFLMFWEVLGGILGVIFDHFSLLFSIKKLVDFSTDFSSIFGWILGA